jgi:hypothetical protein
MSKIDPSMLYAQLRNHPALAAARNRGPLAPHDVLMGLAKVESNYDLAALGDAGGSIGLWQVNTKVWPGKPSLWQTSVDAQIKYVAQ